jgi:hypothetical protein
VSGIVQLADLAARWPISIDRTFGCALWTGKRDKRDGRALIWRGRTPYQAQRAVYEAEVGAIGQDLALDHLCRRPHCVAPHHAEPVTKDENEKRKSWRYRARRQRCPNGHELAMHASVTPEGGRVCRACNYEALGA